MSIDLEVQFASGQDDLPDETALRRWAELALGDRAGNAGLVIRIVDEDESRALNHRYRGKDRPTNVLSFPFEAPPGVETNLLGDLVICAPVVAREAVAQGKATTDHWAHMVVHGCLHLLGHDHQTDTEAQAMEALECRLLASIGIADPYRAA